MTDEEKKKIASYFVNETYDMYPKEAGGSKENCVVCNKTNNCTGHYGLLDLETIVIHPLFTKDIPKTKDIKKLYESGKYGGLLMKYILIPPIGIRLQKDVEWTDKLSKMYDIIIKMVQNGNTKNIQNKITELFGGKKSTGIMEFLSGKDGIFRKIVFGKRLECSARSVITGDPNILPTQCLIPQYIADIMYCECIIEEDDTIYYSSKDVIVEEDIKIPGTVAYRKIKDGDLAFLNRQPTLSYGSIFTFEVLIRKNDIKTIGIHPNVTSTFGADFDGDEMNIFFFRQDTLKQDLEKAFIGKFPNHINDIQDTVTRNYLGLTSEELDKKGLTVSLKDIYYQRYKNTGLEVMVKSKAKGNPKNVEQMMKTVGKQYLYGKFIGEIKNSYLTGLNQEEFFMHQKASREGVVSTGVSTSETGYINRTCTRNFADIRQGENILYDNYGILSFDEHFDPNMDF